ncbi:DUF3408 domain-containing protein [Elizabethkingia anophelis]|uniref:Conjugative transposon protein TraB n=1 Tax=Elizabethkingia anophelis TaxID=1117645 RepID=A0A455ZCJ1_9FLAO|nr:MULTISPECIES: DUF3408 domain-containing protein [Flavobacteriales]MDV3875064.1 DUF3408 domain-containing protein [Elizabethkingia anophelis]MDV3892868.1 DUF3408 domain-containing protein [Elizabethkingia anophelis]MDV3916429.1 DUF3408 domain-containing protein [Elizabethkingia anophelis]MDV3919365.1 DUF3408 domain-containing protein [Elizabethkingia anophelis]MDV3934357.1 DUF3408 domain-containing protein [Elizabethkingia anophelis]
MEKGNKKRNSPEIDEEYVMSLMAGGVRKEGMKQPPAETPEEPPKEEIKEEIVKEEVKEPVQDKPVQRERTRARKNTDSTYGERFLNTHSMEKRGDKSIYIRQEYHERLSRIVQVIGKDKIPLYAYLDNILEHHFELFEKAITDDFNEKFKPIF